MKLSVNHETYGTAGTIRSAQTGETIHFTFAKGKSELPVIVNMGGQRFETSLRLEMRDGDPNDERDLQLVLFAPDAEPTGVLVPTGVQKTPAETREIGSDGFPVDAGMKLGPKAVARQYVKDGVPPLPIEPKGE